MTAKKSRKNTVAVMANSSMLCPDSSAWCRLRALRIELNIVHFLTLEFFPGQKAELQTTTRSSLMRGSR